MSVPFDIHVIGKRYLEGESSFDLAQELNYGYSTLCKLLRENGYRLTPEERNRRRRIGVALARQQGDWLESSADRRRREIATAEAVWTALSPRFDDVLVGRDHTRLPLLETHVHTQSSAA